MQTVYGKKVFRVDGKSYEVRIYKDSECNQHYATFNCWYSNKPTFRNKYVTLNCCRYNLIWLKSE